MTRLKRIVNSELNAEQLNLFEEIISGPRRSNFAGKLLDSNNMLTRPFDFMLRNPAWG